MKDLAEEIMQDMNQVGYVPVESEVMVVIAYQLSLIAKALTNGDGRASF